MPEKVTFFGPEQSGLTAAIYASRANLSPLLFEGFLSGGIPGGQLMTTGLVENFPGFKDGIDGQKLMAELREQAARFGTRMVMEDVEDVRLDNSPFKVISSTGDHHAAHALIIATGATARRL